MVTRTPEQYNYEKLEFNERILKKHFTRLSSRNIDFVVMHHMTIVGYGTGSALDACYRTWDVRPASAHYGVERDLITQFVWDKDYAWATGSAFGNLRGISIEMANQTAGPGWNVHQDTWTNAAMLAAYIHKVKKLGRPVSGVTLRKHKSFTSTACPGPYMDIIWAQFVKTVQTIYDTIMAGKPTVPTTPVPPPTPDTPSPTPPVVPPIVLPPAPAPVEEWFDGMAWNVSVSNVSWGRKSWKTRWPNIIAAINHFDRDVVLLTEFAGADNLAQAKRDLREKAARKVAVYLAGRAVVVRKDAEVGRSREVTLKARAKDGNTKHIVLVEVKMNGTWTLFEVGHFEYRSGSAYAAVRAAQAKETVAIVEAQAEAWGIGKSRCVMYNDEPDPAYRKVSPTFDKAFGEEWEDIAEALPGYTNRTVSTKVPWTGKIKKNSYRPDKVRTFHTRVVMAAGTSIKYVGKKYADHLPVMFRLGRF